MPPHAYFILSTTDPQKLKNTIITRCTQFNLSPLSPSEMKSLLEYVAKKEDIHISAEVTEKVIEAADGSARLALVALNQIMFINDEDEQLAAIPKVSSYNKAIELARLLFSPKCSWKDLVPLLRNMDEDPESVRYCILGYANSILLSGGKFAEKAYAVIQAFRDNYYDTKKVGLTVSCWEVVNG
jgi:DNA polymerase III delta prime subunit